MLLNEVKPGEKVRVLRLLGGRRQQGRLFSLGIYPGSEITFLDSNNGSCRVVAKGSVITLCENMRKNIEVEYATEHSVLKKFLKPKDEVVNV
jgi:Fe2+ transport system protein FeoA